MINTKELTKDLSIKELRNLVSEFEKELSKRLHKDHVLTHYKNFQYHE